MVDARLTTIREQVERLAADAGEYYVVCGRTGERPVPVAGLRFPDRETATTAARTADAYRTVLRQYDPDAPVYDLVVCQTPGVRRNSRVAGTVPDGSDRQEGRA
jgi:hypothetical protein